MDWVRLFLCSAVLFVLSSGVATRQPPRSTNPSLEPPLPAVEMPKGNVEHGRYIVEQVVMCAECHSSRDAAGNIIPERRFKGGPIPVRPPWPNDWAVRAPRNAGLPGYTDEQAMRLLTQGSIDRNGQPLRLPMPRFHMSPQDAADVIAYMRSRE